MIRRWDPIVPGCLWPHEPQSSRDEPMGVGFARREGRCRPGGSLFCVRVRHGLDVVPWANSRRPLARYGSRYIPNYGQTDRHNGSIQSNFNLGMCVSYERLFPGGGYVDAVIRVC